MVPTGNKINLRKRKALRKLNELIDSCMVYTFLTRKAATIAENYQNCPLPFILLLFYLIKCIIF